MYDMLIIGSGPAGMGAAIYGVRAGLSLAVLDRSPISGGQVLTTYEVDNYLGLPQISGGEISQKFREHADSLGVNFVTANVTSIEDKKDCKIVHTEEGDYEAKTLLLATGATHAMLGVKGEMQLAGMGVSYCATCDGAFHRRDSLRAADSLQKKLMSMENVEILWNCEVKEIQGEDMVEKILVYHNQDDSQSEIEVNGVFIAVGIHPNTELYQGLVEMDEQGYVLADESCKTTVDGIYAAGDIRKKALRQIITAVADGANAVTSAQNYLNKV